MFLSDTTMAAAMAAGRRPIYGGEQPPGVGPVIRVKNSGYSGQANPRRRQYSPREASRPPQKSSWKCRSQCPQSNRNIAPRRATWRPWNNAPNLLTRRSAASFPSFHNRALARTKRRDRGSSGTTRPRTSGTGEARRLHRCFVLRRRLREWPSPNLRVPWASRSLPVPSLHGSRANKFAHGTRQKNPSFELCRSTSRSERP